jgi:hypothetical protein
MARGDDEADARKAAEAKLAAMMERKFLDMFGEDDDAGKGASARKKKKAKPKGGRAVEAARKETARQEDEAKKDAEDAKKKGKKRGRKDDSDSEDGLPSFSGRHRVASSAAAAASAPASTPNDGGVQIVTFTGDRPNASASKNVGTASGNHLGVSRARKLFMNDRVDKVHTVATHERQNAKKERYSGAYSADGEELGVVEGLTGKSLNDMRREVQLEAAAGLNKWDRKALDAKRLASLGAKAEKGIRIPATVGVGMWRANEKREEAKRLEQFEAGGRLEKKKHGMRKADTAEAKKKASGDRGLAWGAGNFKGGVLTLSKKDVAKDSTHLNTKITLGGSRLAGGGMKFKGGKGGKGGKKGKGGGKGKRR